ncbi:polyadenylate-binding protein 7 [Tanacetum coccineum]
MARVNDAPRTTDMLRDILISLAIEDDALALAPVENQESTIKKDFKLYALKIAGVLSEDPYVQVQCPLQVVNLRPSRDVAVLDFSSSLDPLCLEQISSTYSVGADFRLISMERFSGRQLFLLKGLVENLHFLGFLRGDDDYFLLLISGEICCRFANRENSVVLTSGNFFYLNWPCGKKLCILLGCDDPLTMFCCRGKWKDGRVRELLASATSTSATMTSINLSQFYHEFLHASSEDEEGTTPFIKVSVNLKYSTPELGLWNKERLPLSKFHFKKQPVLSLGFPSNLDPPSSLRPTETLDPVVKILSVAIVSPGIGAKALYVGRTQKKSEREQILRHKFKEGRKEQISKCQGSNVYVKNIDDDVTENKLQECFSQCGTITSAKLMVNEKGISKGFGFLCFSTPDMKQAKLLTLFNAPFSIPTCPCRMSSSSSNIMTIDVNHNGIFSKSPLNYSLGVVKTIDHVDFGGMDFNDLMEFLEKLTRPNHGVENNDEKGENGVENNDEKGENDVENNDEKDGAGKKIDIMRKYKCKVSTGQCSRAKKKALLEYEGVLKEHYAKLWDYGAEILETNSGSTVKMSVNRLDGNIYFNSYCICFKGIKDGWINGCRKVIGLDDCFLKSVCEGQLLLVCFLVLHIPYSHTPIAKNICKDNSKKENHAYKIMCP